MKAGNGVGKSHVASGIAWWFALLHPNSKTVVAAPTQQQLSNVLWSEMLQAERTAGLHGIHLGGRVRGLSIDFGPNWRIEGFGSGSVESRAGRHAKDLLAIIDEASGVSPQVHEAVDSLNPSKRLYTGNPIKAEGKFFELCESMGRNPNVNVIEVSSLDSPHASHERSDWGMADKQFLDSARYEYGEDSLWWLVHILGKFPSELMRALLQRAWIEAAASADHRRSGPTRISVDVAKGTQGDCSGVLVRDDRGILEYEESNRWGVEQLAKNVRIFAERHNVEPARIVYDATGIGSDFGNRLVSAGLVGALDYMGSREGGERHSNLRSAAGWAFSRRLDPNRVIPTEQDGRKQFLPQSQFAIPRHLAQRFRTELEGVRYDLDLAGRIQIEPKELFTARLKKSPTFLDCCFMTFAYPNA